ncbi:serine/threonine-protein kinase [Nannocystis punicea]|uniref:Serine/threonine-protein kinase n=1 Tax=Nannocystis punicea TaxID=2995304 RepID=A0ABY7GUS4_9BACT|nr:serine/threonine-protein kinase [Nannocystis poenicansa]WAS90708.1 serine/threonine-protein kinase [Nannocystis poenicansa]
MDNPEASASDELLAPVDKDMSPETLLDGRYRILEVVGEGGMGAVYLAEHVELQRTVAIKVLHAEPSSRASIARRFRVEACKAGALGHPHIVQVFDAGELADGRLFVVMAYLEGHNLARELEEVLVFEADRACVLMRQAALGLAAAHRAGIVHRALKPSSVMLASEPNGEVVKLIDFGLAAKVALNAGVVEHASEAGAHRTDADYMAPEQATSVAPNPAIDVYAVGVMLYEMLTGSLPFTARHTFELLNFKLLHPAPSIDARRPGLPARLVQLIADCLSIDPAARPASGEALAARLDEVLADLRHPQAPLPFVASAAPIEPPTEPPVSVPAPSGRRWIAVAVGVLLVAVAAFVWVRPEAALEAEPEGRAPIPTAPVPTPAREVAEVVVPPPTPAVAPAPAPEPEPRRPDANAKSQARRPAPVGSAAAPPAPAAEAEPNAATDAAHLTVRCQRIRSKAEEARRTQRWSVLRDQSRHRECWASDPERRKLQTKAAMELGDFADCIAIGSSLRDPEVQDWLKLCKRRVDE